MLNLKLLAVQHPGCCNFKFNIKKVGSNSGELYVNGIAGRDTRELCQLDPFVVVRQNSA